MQIITYLVRKIILFCLGYLLGMLLDQSILWLLDLYDLAPHQQYL